MVGLHRFTANPAFAFFPCNALKAEVDMATVKINDASPIFFTFHAFLENKLIGSVENLENVIIYFEIELFCHGKPYVFGQFVPNATEINKILKSSKNVLERSVWRQNHTFFILYLFELKIVLPFDFIMDRKNITLGSFLIHFQVVILCIDEHHLFSCFFLVLEVGDLQLNHERANTNHLQLIVVNFKQQVLFYFDLVEGQVHFHKSAVGALIISEIIPFL